MARAGDPEPTDNRAPPNATREHVLLVRARTWTCALPIRDVVETMRALPIRPVAGAPPFVRGLSMIRGSLLPVVSLGALLGGDRRGEGRTPEDDAPCVSCRFVTIRVGDRKAALEVDQVVGARHVDVSALDATPSLLAEAMPEAVERIGALDGQTLAMLRSARVVPDALWAAASAGAAR